MHSVKVLLVDDQIKFASILKETLELFEFEVNLFNSSRDALEYLKDNKPDVVICDVIMPEMNGYHFFSAFKKLGNWDVPFIFLSCKSHEEDIKKAMNMGADDYLIKPVKPRVVIDSIRTQIKKKEILVNEFRMIEKSLRTEIAQQGTILKKENVLQSHVIQFPFATIMRFVNVIDFRNPKTDTGELIKRIKPIAQELDKALRKNTLNTNKSTFH